MKYCPDVWKSLYVVKQSNESIAVGFCCQNYTNTITDYQNLNQVRQAKQRDFALQKIPHNAVTVGKLKIVVKIVEDMTQYNGLQIIKFQQMPLQN